MKKKAFFSLFVAMLLSFGMMAKSNSSTKIKRNVLKKHNIIAKKVIKTKSCWCMRVELSCGPVGYACGETAEAVFANWDFYEWALCETNN